MRNAATDKHRMILSTNPDLGHVRTEFLLKADSIVGAEREYPVNPKDKNPNIAVHVASTRKNIHLPADYYSATAYGKPEWWVARYLDASFDHATGAVYPDFLKHVVDDFPIPRGWERIGGADFGRRDPTVLLMGAIDHKVGILYIYQEYYANNKDVPEHAEEMNKMLEPISFGLLRALVGDPSGKKKNINDNVSLFDHYSEYGIFFKEGDNRIDAGIQKVSAYFKLGRLKIFKSCMNTINEGMNYKYNEQELDSKKNLDEKPIDKNNHAMDSLRYMVQELPDNPDQLINPSFNYYEHGSRERQTIHALSDDRDIDYGYDDWYNNY